MPSHQRLFLLQIPLQSYIQEEFTKIKMNQLLGFYFSYFTKRIFSFKKKFSFFVFERKGWKLKREKKKEIGIEIQLTICVIEIAAHRLRVGRRRKKKIVKKRRDTIADTRGRKRFTIEFFSSTFAKIDGFSVPKSRQTVSSKTNETKLRANSRSMPTDDTRSICIRTRIDAIVYSARLSTTKNV